MTLAEACTAHQAALEHVRTARARREDIVEDYETLEKADRFIAQLEEDEAEARRVRDEEHRRYAYEKFWTA